jgi:hypothetical protein
VTVGFIAPRHDLRNLMMAGAALMALTGWRSRISSISR